MADEPRHDTDETGDLPGTEIGPMEEPPEQPPETGSTPGEPPEPAPEQEMPISEEAVALALPPDMKPPVWGGDDLPPPPRRKGFDLRAIALVVAAIVFCGGLAVVLSLSTPSGGGDGTPTPLPTPSPTPTSAFPTGAIVIAAADSVDKGRSQASMVCDGTDDQVEIQQALDQAGDGGRTVVLLDGTFRCTDKLDPPAGVTLQGLGPSRTVLDVQGYYKPIEVLEDSVTLKGFGITGRGFILVRASHVRVSDITVTTMQSGKVEANGAFFVYAKDSVVEDVEFRNCTAIDCGIHGFNVNGEGSPKTTRDLRYIDCTAIRCGNANSRAVWATGFDFHETNDLYGLTVLRCRAEDNWESGFHFEPGEHVTPKTIAKDIRMQDCVSIGNGRRNAKPYPYTETFSSGYYVHNNAVLVNCTSEKNKNAGFFVHGGENVTFDRCTDTGSTYGFKIVKDSQKVALRNCKTADNLEWGIWSAWTNGLTVTGFTQTNVTGKDGFQSMLGWYYGNANYEKPVSNSRFEITADGRLPVLNEAGSNNRYDLEKS
jgi:hypothetical protein